MNSTNQVVTQNAVHLNQDDMDGVFSVAKHGIENLIDSQPTVAVINRLSSLIAQGVAGGPIRHEALEQEQENTPQILQGEAFLTIIPMTPLMGGHS